MARLVFLAAHLAFDLLVLGLDDLIGHRMGFDEVLQESAYDHRLAGHVDLALHVGVLGQAAAVGFLDDDFAIDKFVADGFAHFLVVGHALLGALLDDGVDARLGDGHTIDRGDPVRGGGCGCRRSSRCSLGGGCRGLRRCGGGYGCA